MNRFKAILCLLVISFMAMGAYSEKADPNLSQGLDSINPHDDYAGLDVQGKFVRTASP